METGKRVITIYTPDKTYTGTMDVPNETLRSIDIFNSSNIYWKNAAEKSFDDALLLYNASIILEGNTKLGEFNKLHIKLSDVIFFHDSLETLGNSKEKMRAANLSMKTKESASAAHIITHTQGRGFFYITGTFSGLFKSKSKYRYIPLTQTNVVQVTKSDDKWQKKSIQIEGGFLGLNTKFIESCTFSEKN